MTAKEAITELLGILREHKIISEFDESFVLKVLDREEKRRKKP